MRVKKITVTFTYDSGDSLKQVLTDKLYPWQECAPDEIIRLSIASIEELRKKVRQTLCTEQLELTNVKEN